MEEHRRAEGLMGWATDQQPDPIPGGESITDWALLQLQQGQFKHIGLDLLARHELGRERYGTELTTKNGRDPLVDAYQESLDLVVYLAQATLEGRQYAGIAFRQAVHMADMIHSLLASEG